jgi:CheY-like chemotaxis protein
MRIVEQAARLPDLMLVDFHLDDGDGLAAITEIRRRFGDAIPGVLITADRSPSLRERALKSGIRILHKPLKPAALRALMTQWSVSRSAAAE